MSELKKEIIRKLIHLSGIIYIPCYLLFKAEVLFISILFLLLFSALFEFLRIKKGYFRSLSRSDEMSKPGAHIYFLISALFVTIFFPMETAFVAISTSIIGDGVAGIVRKIAGNNLASISMFLSSIFVIKALGILEPFALFAILIGTAVERLKKIGKISIQDNLSVPLVTAVAHSVKYIFQTP
ncbi:MAG: hypothetical protein QXN34_00840 [Archaeoglobaceae archaeon]